MKWLWALLFVLALLAVGLSLFPWRGTDADPPESVKEPAPLTDKERAQLVKEAIERKDYPTAIRHLTVVIDGLPDGMAKGMLLITRAKSQFEAGSPNAALQDYDAVSRQLDGLPFFALRGRGEAYLALGEFDKAVTDLTESIRQSLGPTGPESFELRAKAYRALGKEVEARADDVKAVAERVKQQKKRAGEKTDEEPKPTLEESFRAAKALEPALRHMIQANSFGVVGLAFSPDSNSLVAASDGVIKFWNVTTGEAERELSSSMESCVSVTMSRDGKLLAAFGSDGKNASIELRDVMTGKEHAAPRLNTRFVSSPTFSPDGKTLAFGIDGEHLIRLWDIASGKQRAVLKEIESSPDYIAYSPDGKTLAAGGYGKTIKLWDVETEKERLALVGHTGRIDSIAFSPDSKTLTSGSADKTIKSWDVATGKVRATLKGHASNATSLAFSPDGKTLASASSDATIRLWDTNTGRELSVLKGHSRWVYTVAFSPDGKTLASGHQDGVILLWDVPAIKPSEK
jgi:tetratricopeptide (TPR) repeat protein